MMAAFDMQPSTLMPPVPKIDLLPAEAQTKLDSLIIENSFGNLVQVAAAMKAMGHDIGKSAIGVRSKRLKRMHEAKSAIGDRLGNSADDGMTLIRLRLECAAIAAASGAGEDLVARAEGLLQWAIRPLD